MVHGHLFCRFFLNQRPCWLAPATDGSRAVFHAHGWAHWGADIHGDAGVYWPVRQQPRLEDVMMVCVEARQYRTRCTHYYYVCIMPELPVPTPEHEHMILGSGALLRVLSLIAP